jgi:hypothetical protein
MAMAMAMCHVQVYQISTCKKTAAGAFFFAVSTFLLTGCFFAFYVGFKILWLILIDDPKNKQKAKTQTPARRFISSEHRHPRRLTLPVKLFLLPHGTLWIVRCRSCVGKIPSKRWISRTLCFS